MKIWDNGCQRKARLVCHNFSWHVVATVAKQTWVSRIMDVDGQEPLCGEGLPTVSNGLPRLAELRGLPRDFLGEDQYLEISDSDGQTPLGDDGGTALRREGVPAQPAQLTDSAAREDRGLEISSFDGQKLQEVMQYLAEHAEIFCRQGYVARTWRRHRGERLGPFYDLRFRHDGRLQSYYLGRSENLADEVRARLRELQAPLRQRREEDQLWAKRHGQLRALKAQWERELRKRGLRLQGYEVRGWAKSAAASQY